MGKFSKGQTVVHEFFGTGEITKVESADDGSQELTIKFDNGKKLKMQGTTVKFPTEVSKPSLAPETEAKPAPTTKPKAKPEPEPAKPEPEPAPEKDTPASKAKSAGFASADAYRDAMLTAADTKVFEAMKSDPWLFSDWLTAKQLKVMLKERDVGSSGNKAQLVSRLRRHLEKKVRHGKATPTVTVEAPDWEMPELGATVTRQSIAKELSGFNKQQLMALSEKAGKDIDGTVAEDRKSVV